MIDKAKFFILDVVAEFFQALTWVVMRLTFLIFGKLTVTGLENIKNTKKPMIFAPNHANDMDPIFLRTALPIVSKVTPLYFVTYPFKMYSKIADNTFSKIFYKIIPFSIIGAIPIVKGSRDYAKALKNHIELLRRGRNICIFPEGKVTQDGELGQPRGGVAYMAQVTHTPIIPVSISGTFGLSRKKFFTSRPDIKIHFGEPQYAGDIVPTKLPHGIRYREGATEIFRHVGNGLQK